MGIVAIIVGILALIGAFVGMVPVVLGILGVVLGALGIYYGSYISLAWIGFILSLIAIAIAHFGLLGHRPTTTTGMHA